MQLLNLVNLNLENLNLQHKKNNMANGKLEVDENYRDKGYDGIYVIFGIVGVVALLGIYGTYKLITSK